jgi:hypothetical protein
MVDSAPIDIHALVVMAHDTILRARLLEGHCTRWGAVKGITLSAEHRHGFPEMALEGVVVVNVRELLCSVVD